MKGEKKAIVVPKPATPAAAQCGASGAAGGERSDRPPKPGTYRYATVGRRTLIGDRKRVFELPHKTEMIVTRARRVGGSFCFAMQRRYQDDLGDTATFVIRGADIYVRRARFQAGGYITTFAPNPAILTLSGSELSWSGSFRGATSGRYAAEVVGRRAIKVGRQRVRAVGVESRVSYGGDVKGWDRSIRWFSLARKLTLQETVTQEREFGLDHLRLKFRARLTSLRPQGA